MTVKAIKARNLSPALRRKWGNSFVYQVSTKSLYIAKKIQKVSPISLRSRLKEAGKSISKKDIETAIRSTRA